MAKKIAIALGIALAAALYKLYRASMAADTLVLWIRENDCIPSNADIDRLSKVAVRSWLRRWLRR